MYAKKLGLDDIEIPLNKMEYITDDSLKAVPVRGIKTLDINSVNKLGNVFGQYNYMKHLPKEFNKHAKYRGHFRNSKMHPMDYHIKPDKRYKKSNTLLFRYVKHLQKQRGIR